MHLVGMCPQPLSGVQLLWAIRALEVPATLVLHQLRLVIENTITVVAERLRIRLHQTVRRNLISTEVRPT